MGKAPNIVSSTSFYDVIAGEYNSHMTSDDNLRQIVSELFKSKVSNGSVVLDFGGGTGLDLPWLTRSYSVIFLEPSENMRATAKNHPTEIKDKTKIIESDTDFHLWTSSLLPFPEKVNGILMNFAVLNCIKDIELLFEKLSLVCSRGCLLMATIIKPNRDVLFRDQPLKLRLRNMISKKPVIYPNYNGVGHETYLHSSKSIQSSSGKYFDFIDYTPIVNTNFAILTLSGK